MFVVVDPDREGGFTCGGQDCGLVMEERYSVVIEVLFNTILFNEQGSSYGRAVLSSANQGFKEQWNIISVKSGFYLTTCLESCISISKFGHLFVRTNNKVMSFGFI